MELIPAIDLLHGKVVRLAQGDYDRVTDYGDDPVAVARTWAEQGATRPHLVDLEAARDGTRHQASIIARIVAAVDIPCQVAGGIRDAATAGTLLEAGVDRVVLGTAFIRDPELARTLISSLGSDHVVAAVDVRDGQAVGDGWTMGAADAPAMDLVLRLRASGIAWFAVTAIARDGLLTGPDMTLLAHAAEAAGGGERIIASAGVSSRNDILALAGAGYGGAILGRALYEGRLDLAEVTRLVG